MGFFSDSTVYVYDVYFMHRGKKLCLSNINQDNYETIIDIIKSGNGYFNSDIGRIVADSSTRLVSVDKKPKNKGITFW